MARILKRLREMADAGGPPRTLLVVCPNSRAVIEAAVHAAARHQAPLAFTATLNQVDEDGGYTGMTHFDLARTVRETVRELCFDGPVSLAVDHGGPFLKDRHRLEGWSPAAARAGVRDSFAAAIRAGFDLIHVDCAADPDSAGGAGAPVPGAAERTVELIADAEGIRRAGGFPPVAYEVGTDEARGGLTEPSDFRDFLGRVRAGLASRGLADADLVFAVGDVGTDLHTSHFDADAAERLSRVAGAFGCALKGHYTDDVDRPGGYPPAGVGAANVGPEFSEQEYEGLMTLEAMEAARIADGHIGWRGGLEEALRQAVVDSGRWRKWLLPGENGRSFDGLSPERQAWLARTGARYVWTRPPVVAARERLYENMRTQGVAPEAVVRIAIERSMDRYFHAFGLTGVNRWM
jgi:tagatose-1,6-bisphosphate aldolase non-catalytic subunit AgaZ/GatZ